MTMAIPCAWKLLLGLPWCLLFLQLYTSPLVGARERRRKDSVGPRDRQTASSATSGSTMNFLEIALQVNYSSSTNCAVESSTGTLDLEYRASSVNGVPWIHLAELKKGNVSPGCCLVQLKITIYVEVDEITMTEAYIAGRT